jgi:FkbM family methyltransferase
MGLRTFFRSKKKLPIEKSVKVGNYKLVANYEHPIEDYLVQFKYYSRNFPRIAKYIENKYHDYQIIDVGANIGDSAALLRSEGINQFIHLIEGDPIYVKLLEKNCGLFSDVKVHQTFLGEESKNENIIIDNAQGTAKISIGDSKDSISIIKLDDLIENHKINNIKLLKTDTDGFDFKILRGSFETIRKNKPVLFFEYDSVFLAQQNDDGLSIFEDFIKLGYSKMLYYDNFGKFLLSTDLNNKILLQQLFAYIYNKESAFPYFDVVIFHKDDDKLAEEVIAKEMEFFG